MELELTENFFKTILKDCDGTYVSHKLVSTSDTIDGFLAEHYFLTITVKNKCKKLQNFEFFVKCNPKTLNYLNDFGVFEKEVGLYKELIPQLLELVSDKSLQWGANCFFLKDDQIIILENLVHQGFDMVKNPNLTMDHEHILVALKSLGIFHASSFIFENKKNAKIIDLYPKLMEENAYPSHLPHSMRYRGVHNAIKTGISPLIKEIPKYKHLLKLSEIIETFQKFMIKILEFVQPSKEFKNCFNHADLWCNNLLFKYDGNQNPIACRFVDFQLGRYSPPAVDVMSLIVLNCHTKVHKQYMNIFLETYYRSFSAELLRHSLKPDDVLSWTEFRKSCEHFRLLGHIETLLFSHLTLLPKDIAKKLVSDNENYDDFVLNDRSKICLEAFRTDENYRVRMSEILEGLIDDFVMKELK